MKKLISLALACAIASASLITEQEKSLVQAILPSTKIDKVEHSIIDGLYKAYLPNGRIVYVYPYKRLIVFGEIMTNTGKNLTAQDTQKWQEELAKKKLAQLKLDDFAKDALKRKMGEGSKRYAIVMFTDPECPYCQRAEEWLKDKNATIYTYFLPLPFHRNAKSYALHILSSKNPQKEMESIMIEHKRPKELLRTKEAEDKLNKMEEMAKKQGVNGTPNFIIFDMKTGKAVDIVRGADMAKIDSWLKKDKK